MFSLDKKVQLSFEGTIQRLTEELKKEGFGILTQIDIRDTLKKKIDQDFLTISSVATEQSFRRKHWTSICSKKNASQ